MALSKEDAAARMGMKVREIVELRATREGDEVTTHDGAVTLLRPDGTMRTTSADGKVRFDNGAAVEPEAGDEAPPAKGKKG